MGLDLGKFLSISERKHFPTFVATFLLNGGLNHRIFLCLVFLGRDAWLGVKESLWW